MRREGERKKEKEEQEKHRDAAEEPDVEAYQCGGRPWAVDLRDGHGHAKAEAYEKSAHNEHDSDERTLEDIGQSFENGGKNRHGVS